MVRLFSFASMLACHLDCEQAQQEADEPDCGVVDRHNHGNCD